MKLNIRLGVPTSDLLKSPTTCFRLSKAMTRVSAALSFGEHYIKESKGNPIQKRDLEHMSASIHTSSRSAEDLANLIDDPELKKMVTAYSEAARSFNTTLRKNLPAPKTAIKPQKEKDKKPVKPLTEADIARRTANLRDKLVEIDKKVESLCTIDKPAVPERKYVPPGSSMQGRYGMGSGSSSAPKKKPMYPRYFVASMGRSRR